MNAKLFSTTLILSQLIFGLGCATNAKPDQPTLAERVAAEPAPQGKGALAERAAQSFMNAPSLTAEQKAKLLEIHGRVYDQATAIQTELAKSKSLMFKLISTTDSKRSEVQALKRRITDLDRKRLQIMWKALDEVQAVVGTGPQTEEFYRDYDFSSPRRNAVE